MKPSLHLCPFLEDMHSLHTIFCGYTHSSGKRHALWCPRGAPLCAAPLQLTDEGGVGPRQSDWQPWNDGKPQIIWMCQPGKVNLSHCVGNPLPTQLPETLLLILFQKKFVLSPRSPPSSHPSSRRICLWWPEWPITLHGPPAVLCRWLQWLTHAEGLPCLPYLNLCDLPAPGVSLLPEKAHHEKCKEAHKPLAW